MLGGRFDSGEPGATTTGDLVTPPAKSYREAYGTGPQGPSPSRRASAMGVGRSLRRRLLFLGGGGRGGGGAGRAGSAVGVGRARDAAPGAGADCAVGSTQWAEPPQYLPAVSWAGLGAAYPSTTRGWGSLYVLVHIGTRRGLGPGLGPQNPPSKHLVGEGLSCTRGARNVGAGGWVSYGAGMPVT